MSGSGNSRSITDCTDGSSLAPTVVTMYKQATATTLAQRTSFPDDAAGTSPDKDNTWTPQNVAGRSRSFYVLDVETGKAIRAITDTTTTFMASNVSGGVSVFPGNVGTVATRAFFADHDGILWRLEVADADPENWECKAFFDVHYATALASKRGQPSYFPPAITTDPAGKPIVILGTGDGALESTAENYVVAVRFPSIR
jgi:hypothetical protein